MNTLRQDFSAPENAGMNFMGGQGGLPTQAVGTIPKFYMDTEIDGIASRKANRIVHRNVEMVLILFAGSNNQSVRRKVLDHDRKAYAREYQAFKSGNTVKVDGTALTDWPVIDRATAETLRLMHVHSVEQLANLSDAQIMDLGMNGRLLRNKAIDWLKVSAGSAEAMEAMQTVRDLQAQVAQLTAQLETANHEVNQSTRMLGLASEMVAGGTVTPNRLGEQLERDDREDMEMTQKLLAANGLDPMNATAAAAVQAGQNARDSQDPLGLTEGDGFGDFEDAEQLEELPRNTSALEVE